MTPSSWHATATPGFPLPTLCLKHLKSRHGETKDIVLSVAGKHPRFTAVAPVLRPAPKKRDGKLTAALQAPWDRTPPAHDDGGSMSDAAEPTARWKTSKRESRLRFEVLNAFVDSGMADLSRAELAVWLILDRDTKRDGTARASFGDLARRGWMDRQTASRALGRLTRRKMLQVIHRGGLNRSPSVYRVYPDPME